MSVFSSYLTMKSKTIFLAVSTHNRTVQKQHPKAGWQLLWQQQHTMECREMKQTWHQCHWTLYYRQLLPCKVLHQATNKGCLAHFGWSYYSYQNGRRFHWGPVHYWDVMLLLFDVQSSEDNNRQLDLHTKYTWRTLTANCHDPCRHCCNRMSAYYKK